VSVGQDAVAAARAARRAALKPYRKFSHEGARQELGRALRKKQLGCGFDLQRVGNPRCRCPIKLSGLMGLTGDLPAGKLTL
jgi:hypothetical protein